MSLVSAERLVDLVARALACSNTAEVNARCVARALVAAAVSYTHLTLPTNREV